MYLKLQHLWFKGAFLLGLFAISLGCQDTSKEVELTEDAVATVNQQVVTKADFKAAMEDFTQFRSSRHFTEDEKKNLLQDLIRSELILQKALQENFHLKNRAVRKQVVSEYLKETITDRYPVDEAKVREEYDRLKDSLDRIGVRHILIRIDKHTKEEALEIAEEVVQQLRAGRDFADLAREYSEDEANNRRGGELGLINRKTNFVTKFMDAAFALKNVGDMTSIVETRFGYHIIQLIADRRGFEKNRAEIAASLNRRNHKQAFEKLLDSLKEDANVKLDYAKLADINLSAVVVEELVSDEK